MQEAGSVREGVENRLQLHHSAIKVKQCFEQIPRQRGNKTAAELEISKRNLQRILKNHMKIKP